ncbi:hypothetical protein DFQ13_11698 [Actinokineospora spheciospongiae]|nr:hypothetical protein DFQ13_11698 [Actinokineospora spheciospongiae]
MTTTCPQEAAVVMSVKKLLGQAEPRSMGSVMWP